jgi:1,4-alpha-glucan branching enzyme
MNTTKINQNETSDRYSVSAHNSHRQVSFFCAAPHATTVELIGDFNDWQPLTMARSVDGWWIAQVELCHGHHQYQFLVDGQPMLDPHATGTVRNERDERVSLVAVS